MGQYSTNGSLGNCSLCPNGTFGSDTGLSTANCSGACAAIPGSSCGLGVTIATGALCKSIVNHRLLVSR